MLVKLAAGVKRVQREGVEGAGVLDDLRVLRRAIHVDGRQVGSALALGAAAAQSQGFQYIVTMNSDALPTEVPAGFDPRQYVLPIELTDARVDGGLFGTRFQ
jgi:Uncharacterised protein conserved in bacteria (DUF2326)